jgi:hypothetical protein
MDLGNSILSIECNMLFKNKDLYNLFVTLDLVRGVSQDIQSDLAKVFFNECGATIKFDPIGFDLTIIPEGADAIFKERFDYPFPSHGLGEWLCDTSARIDDLYQDKGPKG